MKTNVDAFVLCQDFLQDAGTGLVSIINMVDDVTVDNLPVDIGPLSVIAKISVFDSKEQDTLKLFVNVLDPGGDEIAPGRKDIEAPLSAKTDLQRTGILLKINELNVEKTGNHKMVLGLGDKILKEITFSVTLSSDEGDEVS